MRSAVYSEDDVETAPQGHVRFAGTDVDVVAYRINATDLCMLVNKGGQCVYRVSLLGALDRALEPSLSALLAKHFVVRDLRSASK